MKSTRKISVWGLFAVLAGLTACASTPSEPVTTEPTVAGSRDEIADVIAAVPETPIAEVPVFREDDFLNQPPGNLEILLGAPDLVRREGVGEFRRYDTSGCRVYAVVSPDPGGRPLIRSLSAGPVVAGQPAPEFSSCFDAGA